jgi:glycosyltransferase involved in cell wall biosynthesis
MTLRTKPRAAIVHARATWRAAARPVRTRMDYLASRRSHADLALLHEYEPPPSGGGHQFLRGLAVELEERGLQLEWNRISGGTRLCLFNSFNFDAARLRRFARDDVRMVHRVDGPIGVYRGFDDGTDARIAELNAEFAHATVLQSRFSLAKHEELGIGLRNPVVVPNAPDPRIFHVAPAREPLDGRRLRVIATSWSSNPRKGADVLSWLDERLDGLGIELTYAGPSPARFDRIRTVGPLPSAELAALLRSHDVYLAPSIDDPCSNALLEALACGLPAAYRQSGGHPELVGDAGRGFSDPEELPDLFDRLRSELDDRRAAIRVPALADVADRYLDVLRG